MAKFVYVYTGGQMAATPEAQERAMEAWGAWFGSLGGSVSDIGHPFGRAGSSRRQQLCGDGERRRRFRCRCVKGGRILHHRRFLALRRDGEDDRLPGARWWRLGRRVRSDPDVGDVDVVMAYPPVGNVAGRGDGRFVAAYCSAAKSAKSSAMRRWALRPPAGLRVR